jgi:uncharacterized protein (TIGR02996 family)
LAAPDDDAPRLVYADWLAEHHDPRGELIHAQCALARMAADDPARVVLEERVGDLLAAHEPTWSRSVRELGTLGASADSVGFERGFIETAALDAGEIPGVLTELVARTPLRELRISAGADHDLAPLATAAPIFELPALALLPYAGHDASLAEAFTRLPHRGALRRLDVRGVHQGVQAAADTPSLAGLKALRGAAAEPRVLFALFSAPHLHGLRGLRLEASSLGAGTALVIARAREPRPLRSLELTQGGVDAAAFDALFGSAAFSSLEELRLQRSRVGAQGARALARSHHLTRLRLLDVQGGMIGPDGLRALLASTTLGALERLDVLSTALYGWGLAEALDRCNVGTLRHLACSSCSLDATAAAALASSPATARLERLEVSTNPLGGRGIGALAAAGALGALRELGMHHVGATPRALAAFAASELPARLVSLAVGEAGDAGLMAFFEPGRLARLRRLVLHTRALDSRLARQLGDLPQLRALELSTSARDAPSALCDGAFPELRELVLDAFDDRAAEALAASDALPRLRSLHLEGALTDAGAAALARSPRLEALARLSIHAPAVTDAGHARLEDRLGYRYIR